jgi:hypothetical protein
MLLKILQLSTCKNSPTVLNTLPFKKRVTRWPTDTAWCCLYQNEAERPRYTAPPSQASCRRSQAQQVHFLSAAYVKVPNYYRFANACHVIGKIKLNISSNTKKNWEDKIFYQSIYNYSLFTLLSTCCTVEYLHYYQPAVQLNIYRYVTEKICRLCWNFPTDIILLVHVEGIIFCWMERHFTWSWILAKKAYIYPFCWR